MGTGKKDFLANLRRFASSPGLNLAIALLSIAISIFLSERGSDLRFAVKPSRLEIVSASWASNFSVRYQGLPVEGDITVAQVAIWNAARKPIRQEDVIEQVEIYTDPAVPILNASLRSERKAAQMSLDKSLFHAGRLPVRWKVLERGDGAVVEVLYNGPPSIEFLVRGDLLDPGHISMYSNRIGFKSPEEEFSSRRSVHRNGRVLALPLGVLALGGCLYCLAQSRKVERLHLENQSYKPLIVVLIFMLLCCAAMYVTSWYPSPPAGL